MYASAVDSRILLFLVMYCHSTGGALLAIDQGFMGPNYSISTACATANYAFVSGKVGQGCVQGVDVIKGSALRHACLAPPSI